MAVRKIAISVPESVLDQVDRAAAEAGENRSHYISRMLMLLAQARSDKEITRRIDAVFANSEISDEQVRTARAGALGMARIRRKEPRW